MLVKSHLWQALSNINFHWLFPYSSLSRLFSFSFTQNTFGGSSAPQWLSYSLQLPSKQSLTVFLFLSHLHSSLISSHLIKSTLTLTPQMSLSWFLSILLVTIICSLCLVRYVDIYQHYACELSGSSFILFLPPFPSQVNVMV